MPQQIKELVLDGIEGFNPESNEIFSILNKTENVEEKNEFLFFLKPELTLYSGTVGFEKILDLVFDKIEKFNFNIQKINIIGSEYLRKYNIISQHYGVINKIATNAREFISESAKQKFEEIYGVSFEDSIVYGGIEFLDKYTQFTPHTLDILWQNKQNQKLAGGTYCEEVKIDGDKLYLINGFHPRQVAHFTDEGRFIIAMHLSSNTHWTVARQNFIGSTNPLNAPLDSIRGELLKNIHTYGLPEVSQGMNGVHLSAGPVEGLVELIRYCSDFSKESKKASIREFKFGMELVNNFNEETITMIISNRNLIVDGQKLSTFDLTEEKDSNEAIELLKIYTAK